MRKIARVNGPLRFDKEDYFHVLVFYTGYFTEEIENIFCVYIQLQKHE